MDKIDKMDKMEKHKIQVLPYSNKNEKPTYRRIKFQKLNSCRKSSEDKILDKIEPNKIEPNKSRSIFSPTDFNNIGRVWTF